MLLERNRSSIDGISPPLESDPAMQGRENPLLRGRNHARLSTLQEDDAVTCPGLNPALEDWIFPPLKQGRQLPWDSR